MNEEKTYWERQPTDIPYYLNGFNGTWAFTDHKKVPQGLRDFLMECFPKVTRFSRIPLDEMNEVMNDVWEGPGSMPKIERLRKEMFMARQNDPEDNKN